MNDEKKYQHSRRKFIKNSGKIAAISALATSSPLLMAASRKKKRVALVGTGIRGIKFWGKSLNENFADIIDYVALCDINPGRVAFAKKYMKVDCPTFTDFDDMLKTVDIDMLIVTTVDSTHHEFIIKALNHGINVITEKPMTTDEDKCQQILDAEKNSTAKLIVGFNYRYGKLFTELKDLLLNDEIGELTSIDMSWYLNVYHGSSYFRRWHGTRAGGGTLLLHKASHQFDLLNWWIDSDPVEVHAYGSLEHYGRNNAFRGKNCRDCAFKKQCDYHWDITTKELETQLYTDNEKYDGYIRDNCVWREEIDIFDKMLVQIKYANNVQVNYSLTTYSPFEGFRIGFNGRKGRMETWEGIPWREKEQSDQAKAYEQGMSITSHATKELGFHEINIMKNFGDYRNIQYPFVRKGHWGGDVIMHEHIFNNSPPDKNLGQAAGVRDGAMGILIGVAARKSIDEGRAIKIADLSDLKPKVKREKA